MATNSSPIPIRTNSRTVSIAPGATTNARSSGAVTAARRVQAPRVGPATASKVPIERAPSVTDDEP